MAFPIFRKLPLILAPVFMLLHVCNIMMIITKRKLHKPSYYLILNLSIADLAMAIIGFLNILLYDYTNERLSIAVDACYNVSLLTTVHISIDRSIAIRFCLKYYRIVTTKRLIMLVMSSWFFSVALVMLPRFEMRNLTSHRRLSYDITRYFIVVSSSLVLIFLSVHTITIRAKHIKQITKRRNRFRSESVKRQSLSTLRRSIKDVLKLNIVTVIIVILSNSVKAYSNYINHVNKHVILLIFCVYVFSNPVIYAVIMTDLRRQYITIPKNIRRSSLSKSSIYSVGSNRGKDFQRTSNM